MKNLQKQYTRRQKFATMMLSAAVAIAAYFLAFSIFESQMTDWQKSQPMSFEKNTGSTKFKAHLDAFSVGGIAFCATAATIIIIARMRTMRGVNKK